MQFTVAKFFVAPQNMRSKNALVLAVVIFVDNQAVSYTAHFHFAGYMIMMCIRYSSGPYAGF